MIAPNVWRIARQELKSYFVSPIGYVVLSLFSVLEGWFFFNHVNRFNDMVAAGLMSRRPDALNQINLQRFVVEPLFSEIFMLLMVFLPAITMRLVAEERKQKTLELLLTCPLRTSEIILGKYLSVVAFLGLMLGLTVIHPTLLFVFGRPGPDLLPLLTGEAKKSPRESFLYINDDQQLSGLRYDNWKFVFMEQRVQGTLRIWAEPFVTLRVPKIFNLRTDPYERADVTSNTYYDWLIDHAFMMVPAQAVVGKFLMTFKDYPQRQKAASFNLDEVMRKMSESHSK